MSWSLESVRRVAAAAALVVVAVLAACGEDGSGPGANSVEFQAVAGIVMSPNLGYVVHVKTPRTNAFDLLGVGDQQDSDNWTKLDLDLRTGDLLTISLLSSAGDTLMTDQCVVDLEEADDSFYARTFVFWFDPPNNYADCADNLVDP